MQGIPVSQKKLLVTSILQAGLGAGRKERKGGRQTAFFTPSDPLGDETEEEFDND